MARHLCRHVIMPSVGHGKRRWPRHPLLLRFGTVAIHLHRRAWYREDCSGKLPVKFGNQPNDQGNSMYLRQIGMLGGAVIVALTAATPAFAGHAGDVPPVPATATAYPQDPIGYPPPPGEFNAPPIAAHAPVHPLPPEVRPQWRDVPPAPAYGQADYAAPNYAAMVDTAHPSSLARRVPQAGWTIIIPGGRRSSGLGGLLFGGFAGGLLGNRIAGRHDRTFGTIAGAAAGAVAGTVIDKAISKRKRRHSHDDYDYCAAYFDDYYRHYAQTAYSYQPAMQAPATTRRAHTYTEVVDHLCSGAQPERAGRAALSVTITSMTSAFGSRRTSVSGWTEQYFRAQVARRRLEPGKPPVACQMSPPVNRWQIRSS